MNWDWPSSLGSLDSTTMIFKLFAVEETSLMLERSMSPNWRGPTMLLILMSFGSSGKICYCCSNWATWLRPSFLSATVQLYNFEIPSIPLVVKMNPVQYWKIWSIPVYGIGITSGFSWGLELGSATFVMYAWRSFLKNTLKYPLLVSTCSI